MSDSKRRPPCVLGFYATLEQSDGQLQGGLLVTSHLGRPLEFQCCVPVRPNPTQRILYGATLRPFLVGELIASALRTKLTVQPDVLFVADADALNPTLWADTLQLQFPHSAPNTPADTERIEFRSESFFLHSDQLLQSTTQLAKLEEHLPPSADLREPLDRVAAALREALGEAA